MDKFIPIYGTKDPVQMHVAKEAFSEEEIECRSTERKSRHGVVLEYIVFVAEKDQEKASAIIEGMMEK